eukprot:sb/3462110/
MSDVKTSLWQYLVSQSLELSGTPSDYVFCYNHDLNIFEVVDESVLLSSLDIYRLWSEDPTFMKWLELRPRNRVLSRHEKDMINMVNALTGISLSELGSESSIEVECARKNFARVRQQVEKVRDPYQYYFGPRIYPEPLPVHLLKRCREPLLFVQFFFPTGSTKAQLNELYDKSADKRDEMFPKDPVKRTLYGLPEEAAASDYVLKVAGMSDYISSDTQFVDFVHVRDCLIRKEHVDLWFVGKPKVPPEDDPTLDTALLDPAEKYNIPQSELTLAGRSHTDISALSLWEINQKLRLRILGCEGVSDTEEGLSDLYVQVTLYHGQTALSAPGCTKHVPFTCNPSWYQWLTYDIALKNVPQDIRFHIVVKAITRGQRKKSVTEEGKPKGGKKSSTAGMGSTSGGGGKGSDKQATLAPDPAVDGGEDIAIAWVNLPLVDFRSCLKTGKLTLKCWSYEEEDEGYAPPLPDGVVSENPSPNCVYLKCELDEFVYPVMVPAYPPSPETIDQGPIPSPSEQSKLEALMYTVDALTSLTDKERDMVWKYRRFLKTYDQALPKLFQSVDWCHQQNVVEVVRMLALWTAPRIEVVLELLSCRTPSRPVRTYAVECLEQLDIYTLNTYILQLIEALKYETYHDSALARLLLKRALEKREFGHFLFWALRSEVDRQEHRIRLGLLLDAYIRGCGDEQRFRLLSQVKACTILKTVSQQLKSDRYQNDAQRKSYLIDTLSSSEFPEMFSPVYNPHLVLGRIIPRQCTFFDSKKKPLLLAFENGDPSNLGKSTVRVIFKQGDDITQDMVTLQMLKLMEGVWQQSALDLYLTPYGCTRD